MQVIVLVHLCMAMCQPNQTIKVQSSARSKLKEEEEEEEEEEGAGI